MATQKLTAVDKAAIKADARWETLRKAARNTYSYLSDDVSPTIEDVLDAGRLTTCGGVGPEPNKWVSEMCTTYGWPAVSKFLAKELNIPV